MSASPDGTLGRDPIDGEISVLVVENSHAFEADDGTTLWLGGFTPIDQDGTFLSVEEHRTSDPRCLFSSVAGTSHRRDQCENLGPAAQIIRPP
jgi:hypothetical protein